MPDLNILRIDPDTRRITFGLNLIPAKNTEMESLLQLCAKTVLSTSGQDYLRPEYGGSILALRGRSLNKSDVPRLNADIAYIISTSEEQILREQIDKLIIAEERLLKMTLLGIDVDFDIGALTIHVLVESEAGESSTFSFNTSQRA
jgi:hypothetical protein